MVRLMNEVKLPDEAAILAYVERLEADDYDPDDFEFDGPDSFELQANYWVSKASEAGLFGEGNLTLWPVMDGDLTVSGFVLTIDVAQSPQLRLATLHQEQRHMVWARASGRDLIASLLTHVTQLAAVEIANLLYRAGQPPVTQTGQDEDLTATCEHCGRPITLSEGRWVDREATGDDTVWRETCDAHDTFAAEHEPAAGWLLTKTRFRSSETEGEGS